MNFNESVARRDIFKCLNESEVNHERIRNFINYRPDGVDEWTFADWAGKDYSGETYKGNINCCRNGITSLKGAPKTVDGDFYCDVNDLVSLEGAPEIVKGHFSCSNNKLVSLEGAPKEVGKDFNCVDNAKRFTKNDLSDVEIGDEFVGSYETPKRKIVSKRNVSRETLVCIIYEAGETGLMIPYIYDAKTLSKANEMLDEDGVLDYFDEPEIVEDFKVIGNYEIDRGTYAFVRKLGNGKFKIWNDKSKGIQVEAVDSFPSKVKEFNASGEFDFSDDDVVYFEIDSNAKNSTKEIADMNILLFTGDEEQYGTDVKKTERTFKTFK